MSERERRKRGLRDDLSISAAHAKILADSDVIGSLLCPINHGTVFFEYGHAILERAKHQSHFQTVYALAGLDKDHRGE